MITEIAEIDITPGQEAAFIAGVEKALSLFARVPGCHGAKLQRGIESPTKFILLVTWDSVAAHTEQFVGSPDWNQWRDLVGTYFAGKPTVYHVEQVV
jgi:heme-degrading monooxygenase HmoA